MKHLLLFITLSAFLFACESSSNSADTDVVETETDGTVSTMDKSPCDLITEAEIKSICGIPEDVVSSIEKKERTYTSCFYKWEDYTFNRVMDMAGTSVDIAIPAEMLIVPVKNATKDMFETSSKVYKDGEAIDGVGDMAIWGDRMNQITFLAKGQMIHLHLMMSDDAESNKKMALKIAAIIIKNI